MAGYDQHNDIGPKTSQTTTKQNVQDIKNILNSGQTHPEATSVNKNSPIENKQISTLKKENINNLSLLNEIKNLLKNISEKFSGDRNNQLIKNSNTNLDAIKKSLTDLLKFYPQQKLNESKFIQEFIKQFKNNNIFEDLTTGITKINSSIQEKNEESITKQNFQDSIDSIKSILTELIDKKQNSTQVNQNLNKLISLLEQNVSLKIDFNSNILSKLDKISDNYLVNNSTITDLIKNIIQSNNHNNQQILNVVNNINDIVKDTSNNQQILNAVNNINNTIKDTSNNQQLLNVVNNINNTIKDTSNNQQLLNVVNNISETINNNNNNQQLLNVINIISETINNNSQQLINVVNNINESIKDDNNNNKQLLNTVNNINESIKEDTSNNQQLLLTAVNDINNTIKDNNSNNNQQLLNIVNDINNTIKDTSNNQQLLNVVNNINNTIKNNNNQQLLDAINNISETIKNNNNQQLLDAINNIGDIIFNNETRYNSDKKIENTDINKQQIIDKKIDNNLQNSIQQTIEQKKELYNNSDNFIGLYQNDDKKIQNSELDKKITKYFNSYSNQTDKINNEQTSNQINLKLQNFKNTDTENNLEKINFNTKSINDILSKIFNTQINNTISLNTDKINKSFQNTPLEVFINTKRDNGKFIRYNTDKNKVLTKNNYEEELEDKHTQRKISLEDKKQNNNDSLKQIIIHGNARQLGSYLREKIINRFKNSVYKDKDKYKDKKSFININQKNNNLLKEGQDTPLSIRYLFSTKENNIKNKNNIPIAERKLFDQKLLVYRLLKKYLNQTLIARNKMLVSQKDNMINKNLLLTVKDINKVLHIIQKSMNDIIDEIKYTRRIIKKKKFGINDDTGYSSEQISDMMRVFGKGKNINGLDGKSLLNFLKKSMNGGSGGSLWQWILNAFGIGETGAFAWRKARRLSQTAREIRRTGRRLMHSRRFLQATKHLKQADKMRRAARIAHIMRSKGLTFGQATKYLKQADKMRRAARTAHMMRSRGLTFRQATKQLKQADKMRRAARTAHQMRKIQQTAKTGKYVKMLKDFIKKIPLFKKAENTTTAVEVVKTVKTAKKAKKVTQAARRAKQAAKKAKKAQRIMQAAKRGKKAKKVTQAAKAAKRAKQAAKAAKTAKNTVQAVEAAKTAKNTVQAVEAAKTAKNTVQAAKAVKAAKIAKNTHRIVNGFRHFAKAMDPVSLILTEIAFEGLEGALESYDYQNQSNVKTNSAIQQWFTGAAAKMNKMFVRGAAQRLQATMQTGDIGRLIGIGNQYGDDWSDSQHYEDTLAGGLYSNLDSKQSEYRIQQRHKKRHINLLTDEYRKGSVSFKLQQKIEKQRAQMAPKIREKLSKIGERITKEKGIKFVGSTPTDILQIDDKHLSNMTGAEIKSLQNDLGLKKRRDSLTTTVQVQKNEIQSHYSQGTPGTDEDRGWKALNAIHEVSKKSGTQQVYDLIGYIEKYKQNKNVQELKQHLEFLGEMSLGDTGLVTWRDIFERYNYNGKQGFFDFGWDNNTVNGIRKIIYGKLDVLNNMEKNQKYIKKIDHLSTALKLRQDIQSRKTKNIKSTNTDIPKPEINISNTRKGSTTSNLILRGVNGEVKISPSTQAILDANKQHIQKQSIQRIDTPHNEQINNTFVDNQGRPIHLTFKSGGQNPIPKNNK